MNVQDLPLEIQCKIKGYLPTRDLGEYNQSCSIINNSKIPVSEERLRRCGLSRHDINNVNVHKINWWKCGHLSCIKYLFDSNILHSIDIVNDYGTNVLLEWFSFEEYKDSIPYQKLYTLYNAIHKLYLSFKKIMKCKRLPLIPVIWTVENNKFDLFVYFMEKILSDVYPEKSILNEMFIDICIVFNRTNFLCYMVNGLPSSYGEDLYHKYVNTTKIFYYDCYCNNNNNYNYNNNYNRPIIIFEDKKYIIKEFKRLIENTDYNLIKRLLDDKKITHFIRSQLGLDYSLYYLFYEIQEFELSILFMERVRWSWGKNYIKHQSFHFNSFLTNNGILILERDLRLNGFDETTIVYNRENEIKNVQPGEFVKERFYYEEF